MSNAIFAELLDHFVVERRVHALRQRMSLVCVAELGQKLFRIMFRDNRVKTRDQRTAAEHG